MNVLLFNAQANATTTNATQAGSDSLAAFVPFLIVTIAVAFIVFLLKRELKILKERNLKAPDDKKMISAAFQIVGISLAWCVFLVIRTTDIMGQKFILLFGSNLWTGKGVEVGEGVYLILWLIGLSGIFIGSRKIYILSMKRSFAIISHQENFPEQKQCPMCAESIMKEAKLCKHCKYEFFKN